MTNEEAQRPYDEKPSTLSTKEFRVSLAEYIRNRFNKKAIPTAEIASDSIYYVNAEETIREMLKLMYDQNEIIIKKLDSLGRKTRKKRKGKK